MAYYS